MCRDLVKGRDGSRKYKCKCDFNFCFLIFKDSEFFFTCQYLVNNWHFPYFLSVLALEYSEKCYFQLIPILTTSCESKMHSLFKNHIFNITCISFLYLN